LDYHLFLRTFAAESVSWSQILLDISVEDEARSPYCFHEPPPYYIWW